MTVVILGPCPCQGCGAAVYWGRQPLRSKATGVITWRDAATHRKHYCQSGLRS